jgi:nucleotide-binding universal stress UspA family protein
MSSTPSRIMFCFDDSPEAAHAIDEAGRVLRGGRATVVYAWQSAPDALARFGVVPTYLAPGELERDRAYAREVANRGAALARRAGFDTDAKIVESAASSWASILYAAEELDADLLVLGARGLTGAKALLLGSVSHHVVNLTRRSTLVVPSPAVGTESERATIPAISVRIEAA